MEWALLLLATAALPGTALCTPLRLAAARRRNVHQGAAFACSAALGACSSSRRARIREVRKLKYDAVMELQGTSFVFDANRIIEAGSFDGLVMEQPAAGRVYNAQAYDRPRCERQRLGR